VLGSYRLQEAHHENRESGSKNTKQKNRMIFFVCFGPFWFRAFRG
jgi:hypothetical protein